MAPRKEISLNERARLLAIQSLKERARGRSAGQATAGQAGSIRSQLVGKEPGIVMSDAAARLFAEAIKGMLKSQ